MKKHWLFSLVFPLWWVLYCVALFLRSPGARNLHGVSALVAGAVFLYLTGALALWAARRPRRFGIVPMAAAFVVFIGIDQLTKWLVEMGLGDFGRMRVLGDWLVIKSVPNYSHNVLLSLLGLVIEDRWINVLIKAMFALVFFIIVLYYARKNPDSSRDSRLRWAAVLVLAAAVCSVVDSALRGYVLDYIAFGGMMAFDPKDLYMMYGIGLFLAAWLQMEYGQKDKKGAALPNGPGPEAPDEAK